MTLITCSTSLTAYGLCYYYIIAVPFFSHGVLVFGYFWLQTIEKNLIC